MKDITKRVIILNNFSSPHIQQAIVILKSSAPENETPLVLEAERVIDDYFARCGVREEHEPRTGAVVVGLFVLGACITALAVYGGLCLGGII